MTSTTVKVGDGDTAAVAAVTVAPEVVKKTDVITSSKKKPSDDFLEIVSGEEDGKSTNKKGGIEIVEFGNGGGEIYVGEGEDWVERLKDFKGWSNGEKWQPGLGGVCDRVQKDGGDDEEIVWQDDVFNLRDIKEVPPKVDQRVAPERSQKSEDGKSELEKC